MKKSFKITITAAILAVLVAVCAVVAVSTYHNSPGYMLSLAERYLSEQDYEQAIIYYEKYLEVETRDVDAWLRLAEAYEKTGKIDKTIETLERALEYVDDERIREKLEELRLLINPPVVTTTPEPEPEPEPVDDGYVEYETIAVTDIRVSSIGAGVYYLTNDDSTYSLVDIAGNSISDETYSKLYSFFESDAGSYAVVCTDDNTRKKIIDNKLNEVMDISDADTWKFFDEENGLVAITYSGTVTDRNYDGSEREVETEIARLDIYKLDTCELLYRWNYNDWVEGEGTEIDIHKITTSYNVDRDELFCESCGGYLAVDYSSIYINQDYNIESSGNKLRIPFHVSIDYYVTNAEELREQREREEEERMEAAIASGSGNSFLIGSANNYHGHTSGVGFYDYFDVVYENGSIIVDRSEVNGITKYEGDTYTTYDIKNLPIAAITRMLIKDGKQTYFWYSDEDDYANAEFDFEWIVNIYDDVMLAGRNTPGVEDSADLAFYSAVWHPDNETAKEKGIAESKRISDWFTGITNCSIYKDGYYWLARYKEGSTEEKEYAVFSIDEATGGVVQVSEWYDSLSTTDGPYALVGKDDKWGYIDSDCKEVRMYDDAADFRNGYAMTITDGKAVIINEDFEEVSDKFDADSVSAYGKDLFRITYQEKYTYIRIVE